MADNSEQDDAQKTEEPTAKRLEDARKKGQVALSREVNNWVMLLTATLLIGVMAGTVMRRLAIYMRSFIEKSHEVTFESETMGAVLKGTFFEVLIIYAAVPDFDGGCFFSAVFASRAAFCARSLKARSVQNIPDERFQAAVFTPFDYGVC